MATRHVRFSRSANPYTGPSVIYLRGGSVALALGQTADLSDEEIAQHPEAIFTDVVDASPSGAGGGGTGTFANRPAANTVADGYIYFASDDNGGTAYRSNGTVWSKLSPGVLETGGRELGYAQITSSFVITAAAVNSVTDITGLSTTVTVGARPILLKTYACQLLHTVASSAMGVRLYEGSTLVGIANVWRPTAGQGDFVEAEVRLAPSAGQHTYKASIINNTNVGNVTYVAVGSAPAFIQAVEL